MITVTELLRGPVYGVRTGPCNQVLSNAGLGVKKKISMQSNESFSEL